MDLVDEEDVAWLQVGQQCGEVAAALDHRARAPAEAHAHFAGDDLRERRLAEARQVRQQHVVEGLAPSPSSVDEDPEIVAQLALADKFGECLRPQRSLDRILFRAGGIDGARQGVGHPASSCSPARISAPVSAPPPSRRVAVATAPKASTRR